MDQDESSKTQLLQSALALIEMQNKEIARLRENLQNMTDISKGHLDDTREASDKTTEIAELLQQSNEGLSQALIVLSSLKNNINRIDQAAKNAIQKAASFN